MTEAVSPKAARRTPDHRTIEKVSLKTARRTRGQRRGSQPAAAADHAATAGARMVLRGGRAPGRAAAVDGVHAGDDAEPGPAAAPGHHRRTREGPGRAGLGGSGGRRRVDRTALLRRPVGRAAGGGRRPGRPGAGAADRQHRRAVSGGPPRTSPPWSSRCATGRPRLPATASPASAREPGHRLRHDH